MVSRCCYGFCRDLVSAAAGLTFLVSLTTLPILVGTLTPVWHEQQDVVGALLLGWFPAGVLVFLTLMLVLAGAAALSSCCCFQSNGPILLFTGASLTMTPLQFAAFAAIGVHGHAIDSIATADETGTLSTVLSWVDGNPAAAAVFAATWLVLQCITVVAGLCVALCAGPSRGSAGDRYSRDRRSSVEMDGWRNDQEDAYSYSSATVPLLGSHRTPPPSLTASPIRPRPPPVVVTTAMS